MVGVGEMNNTTGDVFCKPEHRKDVMKEAND